VLICCGLRCYKSVVKSITVSKPCNPSNDGKTWLSWSNDGPEAGINLLKILLDWLTTHGHYSHFSGGVGGETKLAVAGEIRKKIQDAGIIANRSADSIITKIYELVSSYKQAHHIKNQSGETMENVYAACKYFDVLDPILGSRPSIQPRLTNKTTRAEKESDADNNLHSPNQKTAATVEADKIATTAMVEKVCYY
jgi:hypothetical protein